MASNDNGGNSGNNNKNNNNNNNNKNKNNNNKTPDFKYHSENKIYSINGRKKDYFGYSLSLYEDTLVVGAYSASPIIAYSGAIYIFEKNTTSIRPRWNEKSALVADEVLSHDSFGGSVSIWGDTILVGAHLDDVSGTSSGAAYIFTKQNNSWVQNHRLKAPDSTAGNFFGFSTSLYDDVAAVGAHGWAIQGSLVGAAYIFRRQKDTSLWLTEAKITPSDVQEFQMFAYSLATSQRLILVGAYGDRAFGTNTGSAYIFASETVTETVGTNTTTFVRWTQTAKLRASNPQAHSYFGISTAMYFDVRDPSLCIAVVGASMATGRAVSSGAVYVFHGTLAATGSSSLYSWTQKAKLVAYDGTSNDFFGAAVGVFGNVVIVGSKEDSVNSAASGSAYLFSMDSDSSDWSFQSKIWANDSGTYDDFGVSVALWGDVAVVGADRAGGIVDESGAAYVFSPGLIKPLYRSNDRMMSLSQEKFLLVLTALPIMLLVVPMVLVWAFWYLKKHAQSFDGARKMGPGKSDGDAWSDSPLDHSVSEISSTTGGNSSFQSTHGLVGNNRSLHERLDPQRSMHRGVGVVMTASGNSITPMMADHLRPAISTKTLNEDLFS